ncbi:putative uncharacterized protein DDB_G0281251 [Dermacentor albipictus]|uniref:putative uncharacterized protein DDB_G0281251 n=1 Tax=Dermacentor albipictus TaxID=60249 RepID=UPI0038FC4F4E
MSAAKAAFGVAVLLSFAGCIRASTDADEHDLNDRFLDTLIKTKDSRSFLNDLIYKIQLLLNDTDEPQHSAAPTSPKSAVTHWAAKSRLPQMALGPIGEVVDSEPSTAVSRPSGSSNSSVLPQQQVRQKPQQQSQQKTLKQSLKQTLKQSQQQSQLQQQPQQEASLFNASLESLLVLPPNMTLDALQIFNQTNFITNETVVDVAAEREAKRNAIGQDASQRVATLGVIICLTFVGTATCIVVMALYSSKFSGIILLSNGRWWCPMVTRGNGVERQLLV